MKNLIEVTRSFHIEIIMDVAKVLAKNDIKFVVENTKPAFDITFTGGGALTEYILKVEEENAETALNIAKGFFEEEEEVL